MDEQWRSAGCLGIRSSCRVETRATGSRSAAKAVARDQRLMQSVATRSTRRARRLMFSPNIGTLHSRVRGTSRWCRSNRAWCDDSFAVPDLCIQRDARVSWGFGATPQGLSITFGTYQPGRRAWRDAFLLGRHSASCVPSTRQGWTIISFRFSRTFLMPPEVAR